MTAPDRDRLADVLAGEVSRPRHGDQISITFDSEWMGPVATAIRAALRDGTLRPEDLGMVHPNPPPNREWQTFLADIRQPSGMDTDSRMMWGAERGWNRQCSIGWHSECSDRDGVNHNGDCACPCHRYDKGQFLIACCELEDERLTLWTLPKEAPDD